MRNRIGDSLALVLIFIILFVINGGFHLDAGDLIKIGIVIALVAGVMIYFFMDILPVIMLKLGHSAFGSDGDLEQYSFVTETFFTRHHPREKEFIGHMYRSEIMMYEGRFHDALDNLLYISGDDLKFEREYQLKLEMLRCRIMMFAATLTPEHPSYKYCRSNSSKLDSEDARSFQLINLWLRKEDNSERVSDLLEKAEKVMKARGDAVSRIRCNELLWLHGLQAKLANDEQEVITVHNRLIINHAMENLMTSFRSFSPFQS